MRVAVAAAAAATAAGAAAGGARAVACQKESCSAPAVGAAGRWTDAEVAAAPAKRGPGGAPSRGPPAAGAAAGAAAEDSCPPTRMTGSDLDNMPQYCMGRLVVRTPAGLQFHCSGQFVGSSNLFLTSGHCCYDAADGGWEANWTIYLRYDGGGAAGMGKMHRGKAAHVPKGWMEKWEGDGLPYDFCFIETEDAADCSLDWQTGYNPATLDLAAYAYPGGSSAYGSLHLYNATGGRCVPTKYGAVCSRQSDHGLFSMACNPFGSGASGGAWTDASSRVVGVDSFRIPSVDPTLAYSPVLGASWLATCREAGGCAGAAEPV